MTFFMSAYATFCALVYVVVSAFLAVVGVFLFASFVSVVAGTVERKLAEFERPA